MYDYENIKEVGGTALRAEFPRTYIDPNRAHDDICLDDILSHEGKLNLSSAPSLKSKLGIGLIWIKVPPNGEPMYGQKITAEDV